MNTFCLPDTTYGTIQLKTTPSGKNAPFEVKVQFNVPGGCDTYKQLTVFVGSLPAGILCDPAKLDSDCSATTTCEASKAGTFKLVAKLKGVAGVVTEPEAVLVPDDGGGGVERGTRVRFTIDVPFSSLTAQQREQLAAAAQQGLVDVLKDTRVNVGFFGIFEGSTVIIFELEGTDAEVNAALPIIRAALPAILRVVAGLRGIPEADITARITRNGQQIGPDIGIPPPATGGSPPPPPTGGSGGSNVAVQVKAVAAVDTTGADSVRLENVLKNTLGEFAFPLGGVITIDSVDVTLGNPTAVVVNITCTSSFAPTLLATLRVDGNTNIIRLNVWNAVAFVLGRTYEEFDIRITAG
jgi:hypothetical protein